MQAGAGVIDALREDYSVKDIIVTSVQQSGSSGGDLVTESFSLNFAKFEVAYQPQDAKGAKKGGAIEVKYDIAVNE